MATAVYDFNGVEGLGLGSEIPEIDKAKISTDHPHRNIESYAVVADVATNSSHDSARVKEAYLITKDKASNNDRTGNVEGLHCSKIRLGGDDKMPAYQVLKEIIQEINKIVPEFVRACVTVCLDKEHNDVKRRIEERLSDEVMKKASGSFNGVLDQEIWLGSNAVPREWCFRKEDYLRKQFFGHEAEKEATAKSLRSLISIFTGYDNDGQVISVDRNSLFEPKMQNLQGPAFLAKTLCEVDGWFEKNVSDGFDVIDKAGDWLQSIDGLDNQSVKSLIESKEGQDDIALALSSEQSEDILSPMFYKIYVVYKFCELMDVKGQELGELMSDSLLMDFMRTSGSDPLTYEDFLYQFSNPDNWNDKLAQTLTKAFASLLGLIAKQHNVSAEGGEVVLNGQIAEWLFDNDIPGTKEAFLNTFNTKGVRDVRLAQEVEQEANNIRVVRRSPFNIAAQAAMSRLVA